MTFVASLDSAKVTRYKNGTVKIRVDLKELMRRLDEGYEKIINKKIHTK